MTGGLDGAGPDDGFEGVGFDDACVRFGCGVDVRGVAGREACAAIWCEDVDTEEQAANITRSRTPIDVSILTLPVQGSSRVSRSKEGHP